MQNPSLKLINGKVITPYKIIEGGVFIKDGKIEAVFQGSPEFEADQQIDAGGAYIAPGFVDIHVHGGGGSDFMDGTEQAFLTIAETHARFGTTSMFPTTLSSGKPDLLHTIDLYNQVAPKNSKGAEFLGLHLEGPYFAMNQRGAQDPRFITDPIPEDYTEILSGNHQVKRWSAAPELKGAIEFARYLISKNVMPALAHTDAIYEEVLEGFENGYTLATHLYSGMSGVSRRNAFRYAGVIESAFLIDEMDVEVIADGVHLPAPLLKLIYKIKGPDRIALITDSMRAAGMPPGESMLGSLRNGLRVIVEDGVAKLPDRSSFAGSVATADRLVRTMINLAGVPLIEAVRMMTHTPARIMHVDDRKGAIQKGKDGDLVIFNENIDIQMSILKGKIIYQRK